MKWTYDLEYGSDTLEIHKDAIKPGQKIIIVDDSLPPAVPPAPPPSFPNLWVAISAVAFVVELDFLKGRDKLPGYDVYSLLHYDK